MNISDMRRAKKLLEADILEAIKVFEEATELTVTSVELRTLTTIGAVPTTISVRVNVDLLS